MRSQSSFQKEHELRKVFQKRNLSDIFGNEKYELFSPNSSDISSFDKIPYLTKEEIYKASIRLNSQRKQDEGIYVFNISDRVEESSKSVLWSNTFFEKQSSLLSEILKKLNIAHKDRILNLLPPSMSGTYFLYNSAFEKLGTLIIPLGGEAEFSVITEFVLKLNANILVGKLEFLTRFFNYLEKKRQKVDIDTIILAENYLSENNEKYLKKFVQNVITPVFFSIETGIVANKCTRKKSNFFHLSEDIYMELLNPDTGNHLDRQYGELFITNKDQERLIPLIRYRTEQSVKLISENSCSCGNPNPLFSSKGSIHKKNKQMEFMKWTAHCI